MMRIFIMILFIFGFSNLAQSKEYEPVIGAEELLIKCLSYIDENYKNYNDNDVEFCRGFFQGFTTGMFIQDRMEYEGICMPEGIWEYDIVRTYSEYTIKHSDNLYTSQGIEKNYTSFITESLREKFPCKE